MTKRLVLDSQIRHASFYDDMDDACCFIQGLLGVTDGGVAAMVFSGFDWQTASTKDRMDKIRAYITAECSYAD